MTQKEALKLALEALESNRRTHHYCEDTWYSCPKHEDGCANDSEGDECNCGADKANVGIDQAITAIKAALEAKDEPPRFPTMLRKMWSGTEVQEWVNENWQAPPQRTWVGLTEQEQGAIMEDLNAHGTRLYEFAAAIEAKLKEKNNG